MHLVLLLLLECPIFHVEILVWFLVIMSRLLQRGKDNG
jgi:hypothetical protein